MGWSQSIRVDADRGVVDPPQYQGGLAAGGGQFRQGGTRQVSQVDRGAGDEADHDRLGPELVPAVAGLLDQPVRPQQADQPVDGAARDADRLAELLDGMGRPLRGELVEDREQALAALRAAGGGAALTTEPRHQEVFMGSFTGRTAIVTGAAQGIGAAVAGLLAAGGAQVVVADINEKGATAVAAGLGGSCFAVGVDTGDEGSVAALHEVVAARTGQVDILWPASRWSRRSR
jgi:hypothetical protein